MATIDDFSKLELRIGTVLTAEFVEDTDKLVRLTVDFAEEEPRQIISGIRNRIEEAEELIGKQFPFVTNLEPRTIRGFESNGMILVAGERAFLSPTESVEPGTNIG
jgi:methionyl-tRNA synthetase